MGEDITKVVLSIFNDKGDMIKAWNKSLITLIPKVQILKTLKEFRQISQCNVLYKIVSITITIALDWFWIK